MSTVDETVSKVDQGLQEMGIGSVKESIKDILEGLLTRGGSLNKAGKLAVLNSKVLDDQDVTSLTYKELEDILQFIDDNVVPYINDKSTAGQDLLNLFFTTFNKYVGKSDKNQAFTPDHICDFMSKAVRVFLDDLVGAENIYTYGQYLENNSITAPVD